MGEKERSKWLRLILGGYLGIRAKKIAKSQLLLHSSVYSLQLESMANTFPCTY
jgi:hypothetical protein